MGRSRQGSDAGGRYDYLIFTIGGEARLWQERDEVMIRQGSLLLLPPAKQMHGWRVTGRTGWQAHWLRWQLSRLERTRVAYPSMRDGLIRLQTPPVLQQYLAQLLDRITQLQPHVNTSGSPLIHSLGQTLLEEICFFYGPERTPQDPNVASALAYIDRHLGNPSLCLADLVESSSLGRTTFVRRFTEAMRMPPMQYVEEQRMTLAWQRLKSGDLRVSEVAYEVGYADPRYFSSRFRKRFQKTPGSVLKK